MRHLEASIDRLDAAVASDGLRGVEARAAETLLAQWQGHRDTLGAAARKALSARTLRLSGEVGWCPFSGAFAQSPPLAQDMAWDLVTAVDRLAASRAAKVDGDGDGDCGGGDGNGSRADLTRRLGELLPFQSDAGTFPVDLDDVAARADLSATAAFGYALLKGGRLGLGDGHLLRAGHRAASAVAAHCVDAQGAGGAGPDGSAFNAALSQAATLLCLGELLEHRPHEVPLAPNTPLTTFVVSRTEERRFDVPDQPMSGAMDPFFFVTKTKNFVPHEYPCRTAFATRRGQRPVPLMAFVPARNVLPFGADQLDCSGFWFRPTHIATYARTRIWSDGGQARFRLSTPGAAVLFVDGVEQGFLAPYTRNLDQATEIAVHLPKGHAVLDIYFDDLAERDTKHSIRLEFIGGAKVHEVLPFAARRAVVAAIAATLSALHIERPSYEGGPLGVALPVPLPFDAEAHVAVNGKAFACARSIKAGAQRFVPCVAEDCPAGICRVTVALSIEGFEAERTLYVEITRGAHAHAPATRAERIEEALVTVATDGAPGTVRALALLATGRARAAAPLIEAALTPIIECWDCADFALVPLLWARSRYGDALPAPLLARVDAAILSYRYWMDEPGNDVQWYFSENHALLFHTAAALAGDMFADRLFERSGRLGAAQREVGLARLRDWFDHFEKWEMAEFNSAAYFPIDLKGFTALAALAPDAAIRKRAERAIARLIELLANACHQGVLTAAQGRSYEHTLKAGASLELSAIARLLWGRGAIGAEVHALPQLALLMRDHGLELPELRERALWTGPGEQTFSFAQGENRFAALTHTKTRHFALGTAATYRWHEWGYQETLIHARIGNDAQAQVWINHPGELVQSGSGRPSFWGGSASIPRVQQYRGLAIVVFAGVTSQPGFTHAYFPTPVFDAFKVGGATAMAAKDGGTVFIKTSGPLTMVREGPSAHRELRLAGHNGVWLVRLGEAPLDAFGTHFGSLEAPQTVDGTLEVHDPQYGTVRFHENGVVEAEGSTIQPASWTIGGERWVRETKSATIATKSPTTTGDIWRIDA